MTRKVLGAMLICDFKVGTALEALKAMAPQVDEIYLNIETHDDWLYSGLRAYLTQTGKPYYVDTWAVRSTWMPKRQYDQHQVRLMPIVHGRNMAIDCAVVTGASHLLFVDSDVVIHDGGVENLLGLNTSLCGGFVPGRGVHSGQYYVFSQRRPMLTEGPLIYCDHGTCGYMMISRRAFSQLRFRWGADRTDPNIMLSEDPAYALDWYDISQQRFIIHTKSTAYHRDGSTPLSESAVARDDWSQVASETFRQSQD